MPRLEILQAQPGDDWLELLERSRDSGFHQHPGYHRLAESRGEGRARLFLLRQGDEFIALPLLLRPIAAPAGGRPLSDATSVYGYAGPFSRLDEHSRLEPALFHRLLRQALVERGVVSVFSRLLPLADQRHLLTGLGQVVPHGRTVVLDLRQSEEARRAGYRQNHRRDIRRLERNGLTVREDRFLEHLAEFEHLYAATMRRLDAAPALRFESAYFHGLFAISRPRPKLFVCHDRERVVCAGVFLIWRGVVEYHLSGTADDYLGKAPLKFMLDRVAAWAGARGEHSMHIGGGLGSRPDSLFHFKVGFGGSQQPFRTWRWIVQPTAYEELCRQRGAPPEADLTEAFFPAYRRPQDE